MGQSTFTGHAVLEEANLGVGTARARDPGCVRIPPRSRRFAEVVARFAGAISAHDFAAATELFTEDAVWTSSAKKLSFRQGGRAAVRDFLTSSNAKVEALYYLVGAPSITLVGDGRAQSRVEMIEVLHIKAGVLLLGRLIGELDFASAPAAPKPDCGPETGLRSAAKGRDVALMSTADVATTLAATREGV